MDILSNLIPYLAEAASLALVTLAIVLIFRTSFTTNFAQGMISTAGAYAVTLLYNFYLIEHFPGISPWILITVAFVVGLIVGFLLGVFVDVVLIRRSKFSNALTKQMITMGFVIFLIGLISTLFSKYETQGSGMPTIPYFFSGYYDIHIAERIIRVQFNHVYSILITVLVIGAVFATLKFTKWGLGVRATAANEKVAGMMGINTKLITALSWGIAGSLGSLGAFLFATTQTINTGLMVEMQVNGFLAAVLGGFATFYGPIIGAVMIPILMMFSYELTTGSDMQIYYKIIVYIIIFIIILIKPIGLFGKKIAKKV